MKRPLRKIIPTICAHTFLFLITCMLVISCSKGPGGSLPTPVTHGDWVSSGGENIKDANNPWWVKNTTEVRYCVQVDDSTVSAPQAKISKVVKEAIEYWKTEFSRTTVYFNDPYHLLVPYNHVGVATQKFMETSCTGDEDIRFQFGYGTLSEEQKTFLKDPPHYIGIAVRTSYDEKLLRGKGFIFIGSDKGPHRFAPQTQAEGIWQYEAPLYLAVFHELGHVFGIPHVGHRYSLMGAESLGLFTNEAILPLLEEVALDYHELDYFFFPNNKWERCSILEEQKQTVGSFFGLSDKSDCIEFELDEPTKEIRVSSYNPREKIRSQIGKIDSLDLNINSWPISGVILVLNPTQTVFKPTDSKDPMLMLLMGPSFVSGTGGARFVSGTGNKKPIHMLVGPDQFEISGVLEGKDQTIISWRR